LYRRQQRREDAQLAVSRGHVSLTAGGAVPKTMQGNMSLYDDVSDRQLARWCWSHVHVHCMQ
jgi:hypothetical protein